ncbi:MAG: hypothetical protein ACK559_15825 [bacterium]
MGSGSDRKVSRRASSLLLPAAASCRRARSDGGDAATGEAGRMDTSSGMGEPGGRTLAGSREADAASVSSSQPLRSCSSFSTSSMAGV